MKLFFDVRASADWKNSYISVKPSNVLFTVRIQDDHVYVCQHVTSREADALLGLTVRRLLMQNDHVVISEL